MRWLRFNRTTEPPATARLGVVLAGEVVADLRAGYALSLHEKGDPHAREIAGIRVPRALAPLLASGPLDADFLNGLVHWLSDRVAADPAACGLEGEPLFTPLADCRLHAPLRLTNLIVAHDSYAPSTVPRFSMRPSGAVVGPTRDITCPAGIEALQCAAGLALVIGSRCNNLAEREVADVIAGYTVMTAVSARGAVRRDGGGLFESGMYESFAPTGPWLVTKEEIPNIAEVRIEMRVNGELRQQFSPAQMTWLPHRMVALLSRMTLQPGDVVFTGGFRRFDDEVVVRVGDVIESAVLPLGVIRNRVVNSVC